jgi:single-stranded-DNA-specific exonuclease
MSKYKWIDIPYSKEKADKLQQELKIHPIFCQLLAQRGIETFEQAKHFFRPSFEHLHDPFLMKNMSIAIDRIHKAIENEEKILIYGDYDVDGTTAVALTYSFFKNFYPNIDFYVPDRHAEGYGISFQGIDHATENDFSLIIALDCGIKAIEKVTYANQKNIDFIICDHHTPGSEIPDALAILNPKQEDCPYPYKELSGCGIGFKLCQAYSQKFFLPQEDLWSLLDLVCISIACDIVPIDGENRTLAYFGLKKLNENPSKGVSNLINLINYDKKFTISDVVFKIGPRINAAGRVAHASEAVNVLLGNALVELLQEKNVTRQELDKETTFEALESISIDNGHGTKVTTVLYSEQWHKGVVGIVASRLIEHHYRPTIVLCESDGKLTGSARSVEGFNIYEAIDECKHLLLTFGGHAFAAGLTMEKSKFNEFVELFEASVRKKITPDHLVPKIHIDATIQLSDISQGFYNILKQFAPFGPQNMTPTFALKGLKDTGYSRVVGENHLKVCVQDSRGNKINGIAFKMADKEHLLKSGPVDIAFHLEENHWNGNVSLEMMIKDIVKSK